MFNFIINNVPSERTVTKWVIPRGLILNNESILIIKDFMLIFQITKVISLSHPIVNIHL